MWEIEVSPESMHLCAGKVDDAGNVFGRDVVTLRTESKTTGIFGTDDLAGALEEMAGAVCPAALDYYEATGEAVCETSTGIDRMGGIYAHIERENTAAALALVARMGVF